MNGSTAFPFGRTLPEETPLHRVPAVWKLLFSFLASAAALRARTPFGFLLLACAAFLLSRSARLSPLFLARSLLSAGMWIGVFAVFSAWGAWGQGMSAAVAAASAVAFRLLFVFWLTLLYTLTTSATEQVAAFVRLLHPLKRLGVPVDAVAFALSLVLTLFPFFLEEGERLRLALEARGLTFGKRPVERLRRLGLFFSAWFRHVFLRAEETAVALALRGFSGEVPVPMWEEKGETHVRPLLFPALCVLAAWVMG